MISRRVFLTLAASAIASCSKPKLIFATEKDQDVEFTADMAIQMASTFAENVLMDTDLKAYQATPFFDLEQIAKGYMVDYKKHGIPYGYIVFDSTVEGFISSFSCYPNCKSPFLKLTGTEQVTNDNSRPLLYKISPLEYGIATNRNVLQLNTGRNIEIQTNAAMLTSSNPTTWNQVLVPYSVAMSSYTINSAKYIGETYGISESDIEQMTGHYACAVTALMLISGFHGLGSLYEDASNYMKIWNNTSTTALPANEQTKTGVILGSTNNKNCGPGYAKYATDKGSIVSYYFVSNAQYTTFKSHADSNKYSLFHGKLASGNAGGHTMAVLGYATITQNSTGSTNQMLIAADGWNMEPVFLNMNSSYYSYTHATLLYK